MSDKIVLKNTTDSESTLVSRAEGAAAGSPDELQPGELIVQREVGRTTLYSTDSAGSVIELPGRPQNPPGELGQLSDTSVDPSSGIFFQDFDTGTPVNYTLTSNTYIDTTSNQVIGTGTARSNGSGSTPMDFDSGAILDQTKRYDFYSFLYRQTGGPLYNSGRGRNFPHWGGVGSSYTTGGGYLWSFDFSALTNGGTEIFWGNTVFSTNGDSQRVGNYLTLDIGQWCTMHFLFDWGENPAPNGIRLNPPNNIKIWNNGVRVTNSNMNSQAYDSWIPINEMRFRFRTGRKGNQSERYLDEFHLAQSDSNPWPNVSRGLSWEGAIEAAYGSSNALVNGSTLTRVSGLWSPGTVSKDISLNDLDDVNIQPSFVDPYFDNTTFLLNPYETSGGFLIDAIQGLTPISSSADNTSFPYLPIENSSVVTGGSGGTTNATFNLLSSEIDAFELAGVDWTVEYYTMEQGRLEFDRQNNTGTSWIATVSRITNGIYLRFQVYDTVLGYQYYDTPTYADNTVNRSRGVWSHVAFSKSGSTLRGFWNGTLIGTLAFTEPNWQTGCNRFEITTGHHQGIRITKGVARYTTGFTPPTSMQVSPFGLLEAGHTLSFDGSEWQNSTAINGGTFGSG